MKSRKQPAQNDVKKIYFFNYSAWGYFNAFGFGLILLTCFIFGWIFEDGILHIGQYKNFLNKVFVVFINIILITLTLFCFYFPFMLTTKIYFFISHKTLKVEEKYLIFDSKKKDIHKQYHANSEFDVSLIEKKLLRFRSRLCTSGSFSVAFDMETYNEKTKKWELIKRLFSHRKNPRQVVSKINEVLAEFKLAPLALHMSEKLKKRLYA